MNLPIVFQMRLSLRHALVFVLIGALWNLQRAEGIRFVIDRDECFSHDVKYEGDTVHVSFVVIKADSPWHYGDEGVDLVVCSFKLHLIPCCRFYFRLLYSQWEPLILNVSFLCTF